MKTLAENLVTVCIASYNRSSMLPSVISSVEDQTFANLEIIIVDDGSTDNTKECVDDLKMHDPRIRYIKHDANRGLAAARNTALFNAQGKFFTFIDDDDLWHKNFIEEFVKLAEPYDNSWCFCCGTQGLRVDGKTVCEEPDMQGTMKDMIIDGFTPPTAAQFYYTETLRQCGGYDENIRSGVDHDLWITLAINGIKLKGLSKCLAIPNSNTHIARITTNRLAREHGIKSSLNTWKPRITKHFGEGFYTHFQKEYLYQLHRSFFIQALRKKNFIDILQTLLKSHSKYRLLGEIIIRAGQKLLIFYTADPQKIKAKPGFKKYCGEK